MGKDTSASVPQQLIILAAGQGTRMGGTVPKVLTPIKGQPLLRRVYNFWRSFDLETIFVLGFRWQDVIDEVAKFPPTGLIKAKPKIVLQGRPEGIADAILTVENLVKGKFIVQLGDCLQKGFFDKDLRNIGIGAGYTITDDEEMIRRGNALKLSEDGFRITKVIEKPTQLLNNLCGMGTYFLDGRVFDYIRKTPKSSLRNEVEITDVLQNMIDNGETVEAVSFTGTYLNVTYQHDIDRAERLVEQ